MHKQMWTPVCSRPVIFRHFQSACSNCTHTRYRSFSVSLFYLSWTKSFFSESLASALAKAPSKQMGKPKEDTSRQNGRTHIDKDIVRANGHAEKDSRPFSISCEWDIKQTQQFSDDGTNTYFWWARNLTHKCTTLIVELTFLSREEVIFIHMCGT